MTTLERIYSKRFPIDQYTSAQVSAKKGEQTLEIYVRGQLVLSYDKRSGEVATGPGWSEYMLCVRELLHKIHTGNPNGRAEVPRYVKSIAGEANRQARKIKTLDDKL